MCFYQVLGQGKPESAALVLATLALVDLAEGFEEEGKLIFVNADSGIPDIDANELGVARGNDEADFASFCELDRVVQEIAKNLADPRGIGGNVCNGLVLDFQLHCQPLLCCPWRRCFNGFFAHPYDGYITERKIHGFDVHPGYRQYAIDQLEELRTTRLDLLKSIYLSRSEIPIDPSEEHLIESQDRTQRSPQFVTDVGEELVFVTVGVIQQHV